MTGVGSVRRRLKPEFLQRIRCKKIAKGAQETGCWQHSSTGLSHCGEEYTPADSVERRGTASGEVRADPVDGEVVRIASLAVDGELAAAGIGNRYGIGARRQFNQRLNAPAIQRHLVYQVSIDYRAH